MKPETTASLSEQLRTINSTNPAEISAFIESIRAKDETFTELQLYALRFWYTQYHILDRLAPYASSLSGRQIFRILLSKMEDYEVEIFLERLDLILAHYPERARWHKKMAEGNLGGYGLKARVMKNIWGEEYLQVNWEKVTEEEKEFVWWW
ncbi:hypothetical protein B0H65DRAFT_422686 [Neurospora tetraspora]|uniref:Uncharacterized protein n=1 Tax=Neurospora tetraspora TaxID=94610 RepID=A0AAE0JJG2_9PEZI|nr:hypothetical protein B0H65DRAFT_422686 [Neurospora tetraspora]